VAPHLVKRQSWQWSRGRVRGISLIRLFAAHTPLRCVSRDETAPDSEQNGGFMPFRRILAATTTAMTLALTVAPVTALTVQSATAQEVAAEYSGEKLDAFTVALLQVVDLREKYTPVLQSAESEDEQKSILEKANAEIIGAIEGTDGITVREYQEIAEAAAQDQDLSTRITGRIEDMNKAAD